MTGSQRNVLSAEIPDAARNEHTHQLKRVKFLQYISQKFASGRGTTGYLGNVVGQMNVKLILP